MNNHFLSQNRLKITEISKYFRNSVNFLSNEINKKIKCKNLL